MFPQASSSRANLTLEPPEPWNPVSARHRIDHDVDPHRIAATTVAKPLELREGQRGRGDHEQSDKSGCSGARARRDACHFLSGALSSGLSPAFSGAFESDR